MKEYSDLQTNMNLLITLNKQLENDLEIQQLNNKSNFERLNQYENIISQLESKKTNHEEQEQQSKTKSK
jgi:proteasome assembly chaperone (PAC2) family protein